MNAEEAVLGSILIDPDQIKNVYLAPEDFTGFNQKIFKAMLELSSENKPIDLITLSNKLGKLDGLMGLSSCVPNSFDCSYYAEIVADKAYQRRIVDAVHKNELDKLPELLKQKPQSFSEVVTPDKLADFMIEMTNDKSDPGISWGFYDLDRINGGLYPGEMYVVGARPSVGKSQLLQQVAINVSSRGKKVLFISIEMSLRMLVDREVAMATGIDMLKIRRRDLTPDEWGMVVDAAGNISERPLYYLCGNRATDSISSQAERMKVKEGLDLIIIDYLQLMKDVNNTKHGNNKENRVGYISSRVKQIASDLNVPVLLASQLNRLSEYREDKTPTLADLRDSGCIEQDADCVLLLHRERETGEGGNLSIYQAKGRQVGRAAPIELVWVESRRKYENKAKA